MLISLASEGLEKLAAESAREAIRLDRQGSKGMAAAKYQKAVEILSKLCELYPNTPQNKVYREYIELYQRRVEELQGFVGRQEPLRRVPVGEATAKFDSVVLSEKPNIRWEDVAGLEDAKRAVIESVFYPLKRPDLFPLGWPRGILLFGPPGCGKTLLAMAIATEMNAILYCVDAASIMSKWLGESEKNVVQLFKTAKLASENGRPAVIFMDEVDSLAGARLDEVGGEVRTRNQLMREMDDVVNRRSHVYMVGASNKPWILDEPFIRRFQKRIHVPLPDHSARLEMFEIYGKSLKISFDVDFDELAIMTQGYSGSDIRDLFQSAHIKVVRELFESGDPDDPQAQLRAITMDDFSEVLGEIKPSVPQEILKFYDNWCERFSAL